MLIATCAETKAPRSRVRLDNRTPSFSVPPGSAFEALSAGRTPDTSAATNETDRAKASTRKSSVSGTVTGVGRAGSRETRFNNTRAKPIPRIPPARYNTTVSVRSCRTSRPRHAPSAVRTAISLARAVDRVSRMPATFEHAAARTIETSTMRKAANPITMFRLPPARENGSALRSCGRCHSPRSASIAPPIAATSADAASIDTPGRTRPVGRTLDAPSSGPMASQMSR